MELTLEYASPKLREHLAKLPAGRYIIDYADNTHLPEGHWEPLLAVEVEPMGGTPGRLTQELTSPYYVLHALKAEPTPEPSAEAPSGSGSEAASAEPSRTRKKSPPDAKRKEEEARKERVLRDQLGQCLARCGLLRPEFSPEEAADLLRLSREQAVILLPDTNALFNGTLHWVTQALGHTQLWIQPVVISLAQVQQRDAGLKAMVGKAKSEGHRQALGSRTFVNSTLGLLERLGKRYQVLEVAAELLRYVRPSAKEGSDPDQGDVLEDRLLLEAVHAAWRSTRSRAEKRVVTSDVLFARILHAEGLMPLFLLPPMLPDAPVPCMRFEPLSQRFEGAPLPWLLWDMAHTFGTVRLRQEQGTEWVQLSTYWPRKGVRDWTGERLRVSLYSSVSEMLVPEVGLLDMLRVGGKILDGAGTLEELQEKLGAGQFDAVVLGDAVKALLSASLAESRGERLVPTGKLEKLEEHLRSGALAAASELLEENFMPYGIFVKVLHQLGSLPLREPPEYVRALLGNPSNEAYEHLVRYPVYLGLAYTEGSSVKYGYSVLTFRRLVSEFKSVFDRIGKGGMASVSALLFELCRELRVSPWRLRHALEHAVKAGRLVKFVFEPAAAPHMRTLGDAVLQGSLRAIEQVPVPLDYILVGGRPVFTVRRVSPPKSSEELR